MKLVLLLFISLSFLIIAPPRGLASDGFESGNTSGGMLKFTPKRVGKPNNSIMLHAPLKQKPLTIIYPMDENEICGPNLTCPNGESPSCTEYMNGLCKCECPKPPGSGSGGGGGSVKGYITVD